MTAFEPTLDLADRLLDLDRNARSRINMTPSEDACSVVARIPFLLDAGDRYMFNPGLDPAAWNFRGAASPAGAENASRADPEPPGELAAASGTTGLLATRVSSASRWGHAKVAARSDGELRVSGAGSAGKRPDPAFFRGIFAVSTSGLT